MDHQAPNTQKGPLFHYRTISLIMVTRLIKNSIDAIEINGVTPAMNLKPKPAIGASQRVHKADAPQALVIRESQH
jgi:hypothetical protein